MNIGAEGLKDEGFSIDVMLTVTLPLSKVNGSKLL
jgi:hypothetical protein